MLSPQLVAFLRALLGKMLKADVCYASRASIRSEAMLHETPTWYLLNTQEVCSILDNPENKMINLPEA
jgi:hypothetical protein